MDYIITPWFFYWMSVSNNIFCILATLGITGFVFSVIVLICALIGVGLNAEFGENDKDFIRNKKLVKMCKMPIIISIIFILISAFVPSKNVLIQMAIAKNVTYTNLYKAKEEITMDAKGIVDYIFNKFNEKQENK